ncbi:MAG: PD-(D/E)XK nuclease family protein [bacterium]
MTKSIFNHDRFNIWDICKRQYYYKYIKRLNIPEIQSDFYLGKAIHKLIEYYLKGHEISHLLKNADTEVVNMWEIIKASNLLKQELVATEWQFWTPLSDSGSWLSGRIDAVFKDKDNKIYVIDWKTGQKIPSDDKNYQSIIYLYSFYKAQKSLKLKFPHENLVFSFIRIAEEIEIKEIEYSEEKEMEYETLLLEKINEMDQISIYSRNEAKHCIYCNFFSFCKKD